MKEHYTSGDCVRSCLVAYQHTRCCFVQVFAGDLYIFNQSVSILSLIGKRSYAAMGVPGCQLDTAALQRVRPLFCLLYNLLQLLWPLSAG